MEPEELLIKRVINGDQEAFRTIVEKYQNLVFAICFNIVGQRQEAENLAQETFLQVYRSLPLYRNKGFKVWIGKIAVNKAIDWKRKAKAENERKLLYIEDIKDLHSEERSVHEQIIMNEDRKRVLEICESLPEKYSAVLKKYYFQSKTYSQISLEEGISIRTVETRLYRAKQELRKKWKEGEGYGTF